MGETLTLSETSRRSWLQRGPTCGFQFLFSFYNRRCYVFLLVHAKSKRTCSVGDNRCRTRTNHASLEHVFTLFVQSLRLSIVASAVQRSSAISSRVSRFAIRKRIEFLIA